MANGFIKRAVTKLGGRGYVIAIGSVALALGGTVLLRAPTQATVDSRNLPSPHPIVTTPGMPAGPGVVAFEGPSLSGSAALSQTAIVAQGQQTILAEVNLRAAEVDGMNERSPVAISVVLDTSGSMAGAKIVQAQNAVRQLVENMADEDRIAIVTYNHSPTIVRNLTPVAQLRGQMTSITTAIFASGGTMIPGALNQGASMLSQAPSNFVRRVVLISDGVDGSGTTPVALRSSVQSFSQQGIAFSSLGIGADYDESFLTNVADAGQGNYAFLANGSELQPFLTRELDHASNTVVDSVVAMFELPDGWRVNRGFGFAPETHGSTVHVPLGQIASGQARKAIIELSGPSGDVGFVQTLGVRLRYRTVADAATHEVGEGELALRTVGTPAEMHASQNAEVYGRTQAVAIDYDQRAAIDAWRSGDTVRARRMAQSNRARLGEVQRAAPSAIAPALEAQAEAMDEDLANIETESASSAGGRAYGLRSNEMRRARAL